MTKTTRNALSQITTSFPSKAIVFSHSNGQKLSFSAKDAPNGAALATLLISFARANDPEIQAKIAAGAGVGEGEDA